MGARRQFDLIGLGCAAVDDILYVAQYPPADSKIYVTRRERRCGGLTATALVAASRLGAKCAFAGTLGVDEDSEFVIRAMRGAGVNVDSVVRKHGAGPVRSMIVVDEHSGSRNIFAHVADVRGADAKLPSRALIESSRVLFIDHFGIPGNLRAARIARRAGVAVVSDLEKPKLPGMSRLLALVDHPIFSRRAARELTGERNPGRAAAKLWLSDRRAVIVTCGEEGAWFVSPDHPGPRHVAAYDVEAKDTTGCGDVFHGAYAAALAFGLKVEERIRFAAAAAALKATKHGGQDGIPTRRSVERFMRQRKSQLRPTLE